MISAFRTASIILLVTGALAVTIASHLSGMHIWGKLFRRGRGISAKELATWHCQRQEPDVFLLFFALKDPRLNEKQKMMILRDIYSDGAVCPFGDHVTHAKTEMKVITKAIITDRGLSGKVSKKLSPEGLALILRSFPPYVENARYLNMFLRNEKSFSASDWHKSVSRIMRDPRLPDADFRETFFRLIDTLDEVYSSDSDIKVLKTVQDYLREFIDLERFSDKEIMQLCYDKRAWFGAIVATCNRCPDEGKVAIALNAGAGALSAEG